MRRRRKNRVDAPCGTPPFLNGESEQQVADALYRSRAAVHEHVAHLYAHLGAASRAAVFLRRRPLADASAASPYRAAEWLRRR